MNVFLLLLDDDESQAIEIDDSSDDAASESDEGKGLGLTWTSFLIMKKNDVWSMWQICC